MNADDASCVGSGYGFLVANKDRYVNRKNVLVTDLDGTLIRTDLLYESILAYLKINFFAIFMIFFWLLKGKAKLKKEIADKVNLDFSGLPYDENVISYLLKEKEKGRYLVIASASASKFVDSVSNHLGIFDESLSSGSKNLSGKNKADLLVDRFGRSGFEYMGNSNIDVHVWNESKGAIIVSHSSRFLKNILKKIKVPVVVSIVAPPPPLSTWLRAVRPHQWVKNFLVFLPILAAHRFLELDILFKSLLAFLSFCLCASSVYIVNDLLDIQEDRKHPTKSKRAFACGDLSILRGAALFFLLAALAIAAAAAVDVYLFYTAIAVYFGMTLIYSLWIKRVLMADVVTLACLYTMRMVAGALATGIDLSMWLLTFSVFSFCGLALLKRFGELCRSEEKSGLLGRGYHKNDVAIIASLGVGASLISILILVLYVNDPFAVSVYSNPMLLWALVPIFLYWFGRIWILAARGLVNYDPVLFVVRDRISVFCAIFGFIVIVMAI